MTTISNRKSYGKIEINILTNYQLIVIIIMVMQMENKQISSKEQVENFLLELKHIINDKKFNINEDFDILLKKKNETDDDAYTTKNTLIQLNYDKNDIIRNLKELKISEYIETLTDVKNVYSPQFWVFIKRINLKQVYIKVKIRSIQNRK